MAAAWTVRSGNGELLAQYSAASPQEVGRRIVPARYDAFRLQVSASYREVFERAVSKVLSQHGWEIVKVPTRAARRANADDLALAA
jgi:hypothetical protein